MHRTDWIKSFLAHLVVAWPGQFVLQLLLAGIVAEGVERRFFSVPGAAPFFPGDVALGLGLGFLMNRRRRSPAACFVLIPPLLMFLLGAYEDAFSSISGASWHYFVSNNLTNDCMGTSCIGVMLDTIPLYSAAAYSLGAWLALAHAPGHAAPASTVGAADVPWSVARYIGNLVLACGSAWLTAAVYVTLFGSALRGLPSKSLFGPPMFLASTLLPAVLGAIVESRTRSKLPLWVWPLPVAWQLVLAGVFHGRLIAGEPFHWWQAFACLHCGGTAVGVVLYGAAPAYGAIVYSLGALVCRRRRQVDFGCPPLPAEPPKLGCM